MSPSTRRDALRVGASALALSLAGCFTDDGDESTPAPDGPAETADPTTAPETQVILSMERVPLHAVRENASVAVFNPELHERVEKAVETGAVDIPGDSGVRLGIERPDYVKYEGDHYTLSTGYGPEESYELVLEPATDVGENASVVSFTSLSPDKQELVRKARQEEAKSGPHESYDGRFDFATRHDFLEHEGSHYRLSVTHTDHEPHTTLYIEGVPASDVGTDASVFELDFVDLEPDEQRLVETAMTEGSAAAPSLSQTLTDAIRSNEYASRRNALYTATIGEATDTE